MVAVAKGSAYSATSFDDFGKARIGWPKADLLDAFDAISRPCMSRSLVKQIDEGRLPCRQVGRQRRILFDDLMAYKQALHEETEAALQARGNQAQSLGPGISLGPGPEPKPSLMKNDWTAADPGRAGTC